MPSPSCLKSSIEYRAMSVGIVRLYSHSNGKSYQFADRARLIAGQQSAAARKPWPWRGDGLVGALPVH
jgi:hypothetical protein